MHHLPYDDTFKAAALDRLHTAGYPSRRGALLDVSRAMGVPCGSLRRWVIAASGEVPSLAPLAGVGPLTRQNTDGIAGRTLTPDPSPADRRGEKDAQQGAELPQAVRAELMATLRSMAAARGEASYKELSAGFGLLVDKLHLLEAPGDPPGDPAGQSAAHERLAQLFGELEP